MSRTYRKRFEKFENYYGFSFGSYPSLIEQMTEKEKLRKKAVYYSETSKWHTFNLPKNYRKSVNKSRRRRDKRALFDYIQRGNEDTLFDPWNCKTSNSWGYW